MAATGARHREELAGEILKGQVVIHKGRVIQKIEDLPSEIELAEGDIRRKQHALGDLEERAREANEALEAARREVSGLSIGELDNATGPDEVQSLTIGLTDEVPSSGVRVRKQKSSEAES